MSRSSLVPVILLVIAAFGLLYFSVRSTTIADDGQTGIAMLPANEVQAAPDWALPEASTGRVVRLSDEARHSPVVFTFWATWCGPCHMELPHLERLSQKYRGRVAFYGVNSDDSPQVMAAFAAQNGLTFSMLSDARRDASTLYGAEGLPTLIVVDTRGKVRAVSVGYDPDENLENSLSQILDRLLSESPK
jgi:thiol-disulfide isomerase/thioredoxin